ncbi:sporulation membrane protein YtaF [Virgibacillus sp. YIM 98842]|jgi:putative sporulation protein YtaF|uniref:sporulation membrane protein YtaF n=1 Tax=Virgibacillus sp. YIM 98842 TaxID=2663533 RepID=UPI0013DB1A75|nr:sporulation membrane protein YtaF [Virgibacillus sp. YIM 98842]
MLLYTGLFFLVIAVSLDGFGVGVTYGMRKIRVPLIGLLIIMLCSGITVLLAMTIGSSLRSFISPSMAETLGGAILIALGIISLYNILLSERKKPSESKKQNILTAVLNTPDKADLDQSGIISANEALLLGTALALDAFGAGIGASMLGYSPVITALFIACMSGFFVYCGIKIGMLLSQSKHLQNMSYIPPILLIALGIFNIFA